MLRAASVALALAVAHAAVAQGLGPEQLRRTDIPVALVLSGGVSLGSYEAGLSWAVVRFSRAVSARPLAAGWGAPRLVALTGASAGSINALLSAVVWCSSPGRDADDSVDHNLLHDLWMPVGLDGLLPDDDRGYLPGDALLSTRPLLDGLDRFERAVAAGRFRPGCRLPIGLTVTRDTAAEREVGGLTVRTQRFALPWRFEVAADGGARVVSQRLGEAEGRPDVLEIPRSENHEAEATLSWPQVTQSVLASAAFPLAFRARELCDCSPHCPPSNQVTSGTCEGPRGPMSHLSCPARSAEGEPLTLCSHRYVDGGIFDNTPVGLVVDLTRSVSATQPLQPVTYVYIDPDLRRLRPEAAAQPSVAAASNRAQGQNLEDVARLASELVATARTEDLTRTLQGGGWNVTTRRLLYETAAALGSFATVERDAAVGVGGATPGPEVTLGGAVASAAARGAIARALLRCFPERPADADSVRACVRELSAAGRARPGERGQPTEQDVVRVAAAMRDGATRVLRGHPTRTLHDAEVFAQQMRIGAMGMTFLADEMTRVARGAIPEPQLKQFRAALLGTIHLGRALAVEVAHLANAAVLEQLGALRTHPLAGPAAERASATILAAPDVLFVPEDLQPVLETLASAAAAESALRPLRALVRVAPTIQAEIVRMNRLARAADALQQTRTERAIVVSSRFAPITGSQLGNFGAFLDRPFRAYDYYAGVYDASHSIAVALCEAEAVTGSRRPVREARSLTELDFSAPETQRCVGTALEEVVRELDVDSSGTAGHVVRRLARAELEASLGEAAAGRLLDEAAWAWLRAPPPLPPVDAVAEVAEVLLSTRVQCAPDSSASCIRELSFDEFLSALRARGYRPADREMQALVDDADAWTRHTVRRLLDRSYERELASPGSYDLAPVVRFAYRAGELWLRSPDGGGPSPRLVLDPSTIPPGAQTAVLHRRLIAAHLLPYRLDLDVARGGIAASWLDPTLWLSRRASLVAELSPISYEAARGRLSSTLALLPTAHVEGLAIGAGPKASVRWADGTTTMGASLRVSAFQQRFSLAIGSDSLPAHDRDLYVTIGIADLNGALFWLLSR
ncbi:MAG TPA: patatin-like phospholipase family protein [Anaeromyxobacteraceae bacterium]|nr:patatin-like phospholipase family protein [Anaeromyxobacteraceae bacterium]